MEGESGSSGCIKYPPDYLRKVKALCDKYDILLIADEVMSGFGRCGNWFAVQNSGVVPDMIVTAKGITSGYLPLGAVIISDKIAARSNITYNHMISDFNLLRSLSLNQDVNYQISKNQTLIFTNRWNFNTSVNKFKLLDSRKYGITVFTFLTYQSSL